MPSALTTPLFELKFSSTDPLFCTSFHPTEPVFATGSGAGNVILYKYDGDSLRDLVKENAKVGSKDLPPWPIVDVIERKPELEDTEGGITVGWSTKRHKGGSCRDIKFDCEGKYIFSVGKDGVIKKADSNTGKVISKVSRGKDAESVIHILTVPNKPFLVVGDEGGNVQCYDTRSMEQTYTIEKVHEDAVNYISWYYPKSDYRFVSGGATTVALWDVRKGIVHRSEDQEDEPLAGCWQDPDNPTTMLCGMTSGVVTVWKPEYNEWEDQVDRIKITKDESIGAVISGMDGDSFWTGLSNGQVIKLSGSNGKKIEERDHREEVETLEMDYKYRLVTAGLDSLKLWNDQADDEDDDEDDFSFHNSDSDSDSDGDSDSNSDNDSENEGDAPEPESKPTTKIIAHPKPSGAATSAPKNKKQKVQNNAHGITKFDGL